MDSVINYPNGRNGFVKKWHLVASLIAVGISILGFAFHAGVEDAQLSDRVNAIERHVDYDDAVLARKDVLEQRLSNIENEERKIEELQKQQNEQLEKILMESRRP